MKKFLRTLAAPTTALALTFAITPAAVLTAAPAVAQTGGVVTKLDSSNVSEETLGQTWWELATNDPRVETYTAHSAAMNRDIPLAVIPATDAEGNRVANAPTIYLLNGAGGAEQDNDWLTLNQTTSTNVGTVDFYSGKGVNVVIPMAGAFTYYLDWVSPAAGNGDEVKPGPQKWETFLTKELPGPIESTLGANDQRGIIGFSMSALPAMVFAQHNPGMYQAVAGFSGHYQTFTEVDHRLHGMTLQRGGATPAQMLGPAGGKYAAYNDAVINAGKLRGTKIYASNSSGLAGETDMPGYYTAQGINPAAASMGAAQLQVEGGVIEAATNLSTHSLKAALDKEGIPATFKFRNTGTHSWPTWREDIHTSWPTFQSAFFG